jgi:hypothetical protein
MARGRKKKGKPGQQSKGGGDDNLELDVPNNNETKAVMAMTMFWMRTEIMKKGKMLAMTPMLLTSLPMVTMVMVTTVMALLTVLVAMTAIMLVTHLSVVTLLVKKKESENRTAI